MTLYLNATHGQVPGESQKGQRGSNWKIVAFPTVLVPAYSLLMLHAKKAENNKLDPHLPKPSRFFCCGD